jgi:TPP-dependent pyruvate/acetoin dehydrogenase alpha subunit
VSFIGEGGSSLGEWHEAINLCAVRKLPVIFCVQNNQTALSTPVSDQSAFASSRTKPPAMACPASRSMEPIRTRLRRLRLGRRAARAGEGTTLIELVAMRMCGHAHHDDMLYLGKNRRRRGTIRRSRRGLRGIRALYDYWRARDPIPTYAAKLEAAGVVKKGDLDRMKREAETMVEAEARGVIAAPWPDAVTVTRGVIADDPVDRRRVEILDRAGATAADATDAPPWRSTGRRPSIQKARHSSTR